MMKLIYKGDGDYDLLVAPADQQGNDITIELSYDGSDHAVGTWMFWNLVIDGVRIGGTQHIGPGQFHDWLEKQARDEHGHLSNEPQ